MPQMMTQCAAELRSYVIDRFLFGDTSTPLSNSESLLDRGIVDSTGILEMVMFLEERFGVKVLDEELVPDNLGSIDQAADFVRRKQG